MMIKQDKSVCVFFALRQIPLNCVDVTMKHWKFKKMIFLQMIVQHV